MFAMGATVLQRIEEVLARHIADGAQLAKIMEGRPLKNHSAIDSIVLLNIMLDLEKEFQIAFDVETFEEAFVDVRSLEKICADRSQQP